MKKSTGKGHCCSSNVTSVWCPHDVHVIPGGYWTGLDCRERSAEEGIGMDGLQWTRLDWNAMQGIR